MKVIITKSYKEMSAKAAHFVLAQIWEKPDSVLGLSTGSTPLGLYKELIKAYQEERVNFSKVTTFNLDEYLGLGPKEKQSYYYYMRFNFFKYINIKKKNIFIPDSLISRQEADSFCWQYEKEIKKRGGIDLQILGIGRNGHIGFNEPGTSFNSNTHLTHLAKNTIEANARFFKDISEVPLNWVITMGLRTIMKAKKIILLAYGEQKAEAVAKAVEGPVIKKVPASILQLHPNVTFIIDEEAASKLKRNYRSPLLLIDREFNVLTETDLPQGKKVVVISPHPDDASISLGGIIYALAKKKNEIYTLVMTTGYRAFVSEKDREQRIKIREKEVKLEGRILGTKAIFLHLSFYDAKNVKKAISQDIKVVRYHLQKIKPDIIFLPHRKDSHPTHITSREIVLKALPKFNFFNDQKYELWFYEGPWAIFSEGDFNTIFAFSKKIMKKKRQAIQEQKSQISRTRFDIAAESLARLRSALIPEQSLAGFGQHGPEVGEYYELFQVTKR